MRNVLVFDETAFAVEVRSVLEHAGFAVRVFAEGPGGLIAANAAPPDVVLVSAELPRMNGFSICNKLKKEPTLQAVPVILLFAEASPETIEQHKRLRTRANDYIEKPVPAEQLLAHINALLGSGVSSHPEPGTRRSDADLFRPRPPQAPEPMEAAAAPTEPIGFDEPAFLQYALGEDDDEATSLADLPDEVLGRPPAAPPPAAPPPAAGPPRFKNVAPRDAELPPPAPPPAFAGGSETQRQSAAISELGRSARTFEHVTTSVGAMSSSRDVLELREALQQRDRELLAIREQSTSRDRELIDAREIALTSHRVVAELRDRIAALEGGLAEATASIDASLAEKALAEKRALDFKGTAKTIADQLAQRTQELREARGEQEATLANASLQQRAAASDLALAHREELRNLELAHESALALKREQFARAELELVAKAERAEERLAEAVEAARLATEERLNAAFAESARELTLVRTEHAEALAELKREQERTAATQRRELAAAQERADCASAQVDGVAAQCAALEDERRTTQSRLSDFERALDEARAREAALASERQQLDTALREERTQRAELEASRARSEEQHAADQGALAAERAQTAEAHDAAIDELEQKHILALEQAVDAHHAELATTIRRAADERAELETRLAALRAEHAGAVAMLADRETQLAALGRAAADFEETRSTLAAEVDRHKIRLEKALRRWGEDRAALASARDRLTAAFSELGTGPESLTDE